MAAVPGRLPGVIRVTRHAWRVDKDGAERDICTYTPATRVDGKHEWDSVEEIPTTNNGCESAVKQLREYGGWTVKNLESIVQFMLRTKTNIHKLV